MATIKKVKGQRSTKWEVRVRRRPYPTLTKTFSLKSDAENWARQTEINIEKGVFVGQSDCDLRLFNDLIQKYATDITPGKRGSAVETIRLKKLGRHPLANLEVKDLKPLHFIKYRNERLKEVSGSSVRKELALLSHVLSVAKQEWGVDLQSNPLGSVTKPKESKQRERRLEVNEETSLLKSSSNSRNHWLTPIIIVAIETGMRRGELLNLNWEDINLDLRVAHLDITKNGSSISLRLLPELPLRHGCKHEGSVSVPP
jgi:integrase